MHVARMLLLAMVCSTGCREASTQNIDGSSPTLDAAAPAPAASVTMRADPKTYAIDEETPGTKRPVLVVIGIDPWAEVRGADVPRTVIYEDGTIIASRGKTTAQGRRTFESKLDPQAAARFAAIRADPALVAVPARLGFSHATDQPTAQLIFRVGDRWKMIIANGLYVDGTPTHPARELMPVPPPLANALGTIEAFAMPDAPEWKPDTVEIMLSDFSHSKKPPLPWPNGVPRPPAGFKAPEGGVHKHFVPAAAEPKLEELQRSRDAYTGVGLDGKTWSLNYRRVVPNQALIQRVETCCHLLSIEETVNKMPPIPAYCHR